MFFSYICRKYCKANVTAIRSSIVIREKRHMHNLLLRNYITKSLGYSQPGECDFYLYNFYLDRYLYIAISREFYLPNY